MSLAWSFFSFSPDRFDAFFGGDLPDAENVIVQAVTWDDELWDDPMLPAHIARRLARQGIDYRDLTPVEASLLDDIVPILFRPEGMAADLEVEETGVEGLTPAGVRNLLDRAEDKADLTWLPALLKGRRAGSEGGDARCLYVLLGPGDVETLRDEISALLERDGEWDAPEQGEIVREDLLPLLEQLAEDGGSLAGFLR